MKKLILLFIAAISAAQVHAQNINPEVDYVPGNGKNHCDKKSCCEGESRFTGWSFDINATGGLLWQNINGANMAATYNSAVNTNIAQLKYENGISRGIDIQAGYFFGKSRHFGIGTGLLYMYQEGDLVMNNFHVEYRSTDNFSNTFRQVLSANHQVKESVSTHNLNIPLVFKYRTNCSKKVGFTADMGLLFNVLEKNNFKTNASFDYEAIYKYTGTQGNVTTVYDNSAVPAQGDLLITKTKYAGTTSNSNIQDYFNKLKADGYNVGLGVRANNNKGSVSYNTVSVGFIVRPAISLCITEAFSLNLGLYYIYQNFTNNASSNYRITNKSGDYSSMMNGVDHAVNSSLGFNVGARFNICKPKPAAAPPAEDMAPPAEEEPKTPVASPVDNDDEPEAEPINISTPILFDLDKTVIKSSSYPILEEAVRTLNENKKAAIVIHGYTDNTGAAAYNRTLSKKRANAVKNYLHEKGVKSRSLKTVGHGSKEPAASNSTSEGRARNRRAVMKLKTGK